MALVSAQCTRTPSAPQAPFDQLPSRIARDGSIPAPQKVLLLILNGHAWGAAVTCYPSTATLAAAVGLSEKHTARLLADLERRGLIRRRRADNATGREFVLLWKIARTPSAPMRAKGTAPARSEADSSERSKKIARCAGPKKPARPPCLAPGTNGSDRPWVRPTREAASESDLIELRRWLAGSDPVKRRCAEAVLGIGASSSSGFAGISSGQTPENNVPGIPPSAHSDHVAASEPLDQGFGGIRSRVSRPLAETSRAPSRSYPRYPTASFPRIRMDSEQQESSLG